MKLKDKVAIVTGGGTGIGKATAVELSKEGAKVVVAGRREEPLKEVVEEIINAGGEAAYFVTDVRYSDQVDRLIDNTVKKFGAVDILFNNAGINLTKTIIDTTDEEVDDLLDTHVKGTFWGMRAAARQMKKQKNGGVIINMSSMSGLLGHPYRTVYCGCKAAIINMTRCAGLELADYNIRVNVICPGVIETPIVEMNRKSDPEVLEGYVQSIPMKRIADPKEVARAVVFLVSDDSSYVTGAYLAVDGGFTAGK